MGLLQQALGYLIDMQKLGSSPYYFMGELVVLTNYFAFYRTLFATVEDPYAFAGVQALHCASEWLVYPLRSTHAYYKVTSQLIACTSCCLPRRLAELVRTGITWRDWQVCGCSARCMSRGFVVTGVLCSLCDSQAFVALEYGLRVSMMVPACVCGRITPTPLTHCEHP